MWFFFAMENVWFLFFCFLWRLCEIFVHICMWCAQILFFFYVYGAVPKEEEEKKEESWQCGLVTIRLWAAHIGNAKRKNCGQGSVRPFHFYPDCFLSAFFGYDSWRVSIDWFFARSYLYTEHEGAAHFHVMLRNTDRKMFVILSVKSFATIRNPGLKLREKQNCQGIWCRKFSIPGDLGKREAGCVYIN